MSEQSFFKSFLSLGGILLIFYVLMSVKTIDIKGGSPLISQASLIKTPQELAQQIVRGWEQKEVAAFSRYFANEVYFSLSEEHNWFSKKQTIGLIRQYFQSIQIESLTLKTVEKRYCTFKQSYTKDGKSETCLIFLCYEKYGEVLKINRVEQE